MKLRVDSPIITVGIKITNLLIINLFWWIGCLPIVTIGTSTIAAYSLTLKMAEDSEPSGITKAFWSAWIHNLKHGIPLTLIFAFACYSAWISWQIFDQVDGNPMIFLVMTLIIILLLVMHYLYVCPLEARYQNSLWNNLHNARRIFARFFLRSLGMLVMLVAQFLLFTQVTPILTYIGLFCGPVLMFYTTSQITMPIFRKLEKDGTASDGMSITGNKDDHEYGGIY